MCLSKTCLALCTTWLSPCFSLSPLLLLFLPPLSLFPVSTLWPPCSLHFCCMICRYISPRGSLSVLPSVWGNAAHFWRPQLSAQSLLLFLHLLPNPAAHHFPTGLHTPDLRILTSPLVSVPGSAQPHPVSPAQPFSSHALVAPSTAPPQCPLLLSAHAPRHPIILSTRRPPLFPSVPLLSPPPESTVIPLPVHVLPLCLLCLCRCSRLPLFVLSVNFLLVSSICSALLPSTAASATS